jgi:hypothetical protein
MSQGASPAKSSSFGEFLAGKGRSKRVQPNPLPARF